jgi:DMSO/TMAO reductase YedYZ molybdopterin-dependent catalytic subunit
MEFSLEIPQTQGRPELLSIDLVDAFHPQALLTYGMNDQPLSVGHGAPPRLRVERQLGYLTSTPFQKATKSLMFAAAVDGSG